MLVARGANINSVNEYGYTPLHLATWKGNFDPLFKFCFVQ